MVLAQVYPRLEWVENLYLVEKMMMALTPKLNLNQRKKRKKEGKHAQSMSRVLDQDEANGL